MLAFLVSLWLIVPALVGLALALAPSIPQLAFDGHAEESEATDALIAVRTARSLFALAHSAEVQIAFASRYGRRSGLAIDQGAIRARALRRQAVLVLSGVVGVQS
jgi:hypothetical protein